MAGKTLIAAAGLWWAIGAALPLTEQSPYALFETHTVPRSWTLVGDASEDGVILLQIGLRQSSFKELERHLLEGEPPSIFYLV
jgi:tripeptidyl-peptidase-1